MSVPPIRSGAISGSTGRKECAFARLASARNRRLQRLKCCKNMLGLACTCPGASSDAANGVNRDGELHESTPPRLALSLDRNKLLEAEELAQARKGWYGARTADPLASASVRDLHCLSASPAAVFHVVAACRLLQMLWLPLESVGESCRSGFCAIKPPRSRTRVSPASRAPIANWSAQGSAARADVCLVCLRF